MARVYLLWLCVFGLAYVAPCASCPSIGLVVRGRIGLVATQHSMVWCRQHAHPGLVHAAHWGGASRSIWLVATTRPTCRVRSTARSRTVIERARQSCDLR